MEPVSTTLIHYDVKNCALTCLCMHLALFDMDLLSCSMARIGHSGMTADEVTENIEAAVKTVMEKIRMVSAEAQRVVCPLGSFPTVGPQSYLIRFHL